MSQHRRSRPRRLGLRTWRLLNAQLALYRLLRTPRPLDDLLQAILDTALANVPGAQRGSLMVREDSSLVFRAANGYNLAALRAVRLPLAEINALLGTSRSVQTDDYAEWDAQHLSPEDNRILREHGGIEEIRRSLVSTIYVSGQFYGSLVLDNLHSYAPFPSEAEMIARLFAEQAGTLLEQALLLEQLQQTSSQLVEAERLGSLGRFIASIAHEINNPLTAVLGYADFLSQSELDAEALAMLDQLRYGAERVRTIVRNLQLYARQQQSGMSQVQLNLLVEQTLMLTSGDLKQQQIAVVLRLDPDVPITWADGGQLSQVLLNLLVNAQHALQLRPPPRELVVQTALESRDDGPWLLLRVTDNGPGVAPELQARIFEPFFSTKPAGQGTGLGLSICRGIVQAHGGTLVMESTPGAGASFTVSLPLRPVPSAPVTAPSEPTGVVRPAGLRVLLIDDDPTVLNIVLRSLERDNSVQVANGGVAGLRLALAGAYDLILCDLRMPGFDGLELFKELQATRPELAARLIFISGDTSSLETRTGLGATGRPLLTKPFHPQELYRAIAALRA